jgi:HPt (histidine-containing phosphotransfer) domain-containing protein
MRNTDQSSDRPTGQSGASPDARVSEAIEEMWARFRPQILDRVALLESAASAVIAKNLTTSECEAAHAAAHKLAGTLGMFNLKRGTDLARELQFAYSPESPPAATSGQHLASLALELWTMIENRESGIESRKSGS